MPQPFAFDGREPPQRRELLPRRIEEMLGTRKRNDEGVNRGRGFTKGKRMNREVSDRSDFEKGIESTAMIK